MGVQNVEEDIFLTWMLANFLVLVSPIMVPAADHNMERRGQTQHGAEVTQSALAHSQYQLGCMQAVVRYSSPVMT